MASFFIDRPIFAWVIAILIMLAGGIAIKGLPVAQYPAIAPPNISIAAVYPGASAKTLEDSVTQVIEQKMNGLDNLRYIASTSDSAGNATVTLTFDAVTNPDIAQVQVQNKLQLAMPLLPQEVQRQGVRVQKAVNNFLLIVAFVSADGSMGALRHRRLPGHQHDRPDQPRHRRRRRPVLRRTVRHAHLARSRKLVSFQMTPQDVSAAVQAQNALVSAGQLGGAPSVAGQQLNATITAQTRLQTVAEFENILLRVNPNGSQVRLRDVARAEIAGEELDIDSTYNSERRGGMGIKLAPGANALDTVKAVKARFDGARALLSARPEDRLPDRHL